MSALGKKLECASFRYEDIEVALNGELAARRTALLGEIQKATPATARLAQDPAAELRKELEKVEAELRESVVTIRVRAMDTDKWNALTLRYQPRKDAAIDKQKGYDIIAVTKESVQATGVLIHGGKTEQVTADEWKDLWEKIDAGDFDRFWMAITRLNETNGWTGVDYLKKGSTRTPASSGT